MAPMPAPDDRHQPEGEHLNRDGPLRWQINDGPPGEQTGPADAAHHGFIPKNREGFREKEVRLKE
jgi:hypothetical protein